MQISDERIEEFKQIYKKEFGKEISNTEARESAQNLLNYVKLCYDMHAKECKRKAKLKDNPKGFHYDDNGIYSCPICGKQMCNTEVWYDECGQKCLDCQDNLNKKRIPKSVFKNRDSWYSYWSLESKFGLKKKDARKLVKEGKLKTRTLKNRQGHNYFELFLIKDNPVLK